MFEIMYQLDCVWHPKSKAEILLNLATFFFTSAVNVVIELQMQCHCAMLCSRKAPPPPRHLPPPSQFNSPESNSGKSVLTDLLPKEDYGSWHFLNTNES